jgi:hypothetical protein
MLGQINKSSRPEAIRALLHVEPNYWYASDAWKPGAGISLNSDVQNVPTGNYLGLLGESAFCPSPMGNVSLETGRPYSALEAGSIPLLERRSLMDVHRRLLGNHPLPTFSSWKRAADFVREMWADKKALDQLQRECLTWWADYKRNLAMDVVRFVDRLWNNHASGINEFMRGYARMPGWPELELLRHHSLPALTRRIRRQATRIVREGKIYERW